MTILRDVDKMGEDMYVQRDGRTGGYGVRSGFVAGGNTTSGSFSTGLEASSWKGFFCVLFAGISVFTNARGQVSRSVSLLLMAILHILKFAGITLRWMPSTT